MYVDSSQSLKNALFDQKVTFGKASGMFLLLILVAGCHMIFITTHYDSEKTIPLEFFLFEAIVWKRWQ